MSLRFALRGTSLNAWYSTAGSSPGFFSNLGNADYPALVANANAGVFGGSVIDMVPNSVTKGMNFIGRGNLGATNNNGSFAVLARLVPTLTQSPCTGYGVIECGNCFGLHGNGYRLGINATGNPFIQLADQAGNILTYTSAHVLNVVQNVPFDIMFTWDGTTNAGSLKVSIDGIEVDTFTPDAQVAVSNRDVQSLPTFGIGETVSSPIQTKLRLNELLIWDTQEAHVYAARTGFWPVASFDGLVSTDPGAANVLSGIAYMINGAAFSGSLIKNYLSKATVKPGAGQAPRDLLAFTQGDDVSLILFAQNGLGAPIDLTGATLTTFFPAADGTQVTIATTDTANAKIGEHLSVLTKVVQGGKILFFHATASLTVLSPSTV